MTKRILVIDDEVDILEIANLSLAVFGGYEVTTASSGAEGIQLAIAEQPDAVLSDARMPGIDGPEVFAALRDNPVTAPIPVIFVTASLQLHEKNILLSLSPAGMIEKPFNPETLASEVAAILGWD